MNNRRTLLFAGTTEGRQLAQRYAQHGLPLLICVATEYGKETLEEIQMLKEKKMDDLAKIEIRVGRLDNEQMENLMITENPIEVIDATHPFATVVTQQIQQLCQQLHFPYLRICRESLDINEINFDARNINYVDDWQQAMEKIEKMQGNILFTTGSKDLLKIMKDCKNLDRVFVRVLPSIESMQLCQDAGIKKQNIVAMQGPFSKEMNKAIIQEFQISCLVTKEAGHHGGFDEKYLACEEMGISIVIIGRPIQESGVSLETFFETRKLDSKNLRESLTIQLVGIGTGHPEGITIEGKKAILAADVVFGAKRMIDFCVSIGRKDELIEEYRGAKILKQIEEGSWNNIVVVLSGDVGFFSGAKKIKECFSKEMVKVIPGISIVQALCGKAGRSWEKMKLISCHGQDKNPIPEIIRHKECFLIFSNGHQVAWLAKECAYYGLDQVEFCVGLNIGSEDEYFTTGESNTFLDFSREGLCAVIVENLGANEVLTIEEKDEHFIRGDAPMTKQEIRTLSIGKLQLATTSVVFDIGSGTGSVGIACAKIAYEGQVYGIEKEEKNEDVLMQNRRLHQVPNFFPIIGEATKVMNVLPTPTHAFVGGSGGNIEEILNQLYEKNPQIKMVINAITLETLGQITQYAKENMRKLEIIQVSITKTKEVGTYHMLWGTNPIFIMTLGEKK